MKRVLCLYVDGEFVDIAKAKGVNLSQMFNDILKQTLKVPNIEKQDDQTQKDFIKKLQHDKAILQQNVKNLTNQIEQLQKEEDAEIEKREKETVFEF